MAPIPPTKTTPVPPNIFTLEYRSLLFQAPYNKADFFKFRPGHFIWVRMNLAQDIQAELESEPIVVFQIRITETFEWEQCGSGFPCRDEPKAEEVQKVIDRKNQTVPVVMKMSWQGHFGIVTMTNYEMCYDEFTFYIYHQPKKVGATSSKFAIRKYEHFLGKPKRLAMEEMLVADDKEKALELFKTRNDEIRSEELASLPARNTGQNAQEIQSLNESELLVLEKSFPETVPILRGDIKASPEETYAAYQRDIFSHSGKMPEPIKFNEAQFIKVATELFNKRRRAKLGIDPVAYELVTGWYFRGYARMTPQGRADAIKERGFGTFSGEKIRKTCEKLKLPALRQPGHH